MRNGEYLICLVRDLFKEVVMGSRAARLSGLVTVSIGQDPVHSIASRAAPELYG